MKNAVFFALMAQLLFPVAQASPGVVYGEDNRREVYEAIPLYQALARSTAVMVPEREIKRSTDGLGKIQLKQQSLKEWFDAMSSEDVIQLKMSSSASNLLMNLPEEGVSFCEETKFIHQPNPGECSGFLIAPDLLVTAGHCVEEENFCEDNMWIFDYQLDKETQTAGLYVKEGDIYGCKAVVSNRVDEAYGLDYGVVRLDRPVVGRSPLKLRSETKIPDNQALVVIGNPNGQPTKVADGANVRGNTHPKFFTANLDTFQGNSGSAVFNPKTGMVEGILVGGEEDFRPNLERKCMEVFRCEDHGCRGEDVSRISSIPEVAYQRVLNNAAVAGNKSVLDALLEHELWLDFYTADGQSSLIKAVEASKLVSVDWFLKHGAEVNLQDAKGESALHKLARKLSKSSAGILESLLKGGANLELKNHVGQTPLQVARKAGNRRGTRLLILAGAKEKSLKSKF